MYRITDGQVITTSPVFPTSSDAVVITFNADKGDMGLKDYSGDDIYAHTGVITDKSLSGSDWKYVVAPWGTFLPKAKLTRVSANVYTLNIGPSIRAYYGVPSSEKILKLAIVFRNSATTPKTGRDAGGADIFYNVSENPVFEVMISKPDKYTSLVSSGQNITIQASASMGDSLIILQNDVRLKKVTELTTTHTVTTTGSGLFKIVARAWNKEIMKEDSVFYFIRPPVVTGDYPEGTRAGVNVSGGSSATFLLYAPGKDHVFITGDFNNWVFRDEGYMKKSSDGDWFWLTVYGLNPDEEYGFQYIIDESIRIPDPYATKILDPWNDKYITTETYPGLKPYPEGKAEGLVSVFKTNPDGYEWKNSTFSRPDPSDLVVYELHIRDFIEAHDFKTIIDSLDYFTRLGVNAIELMPVNEFEGNSSWGYNPSMYFAVDKFYGPAVSFKEFVDSCHGRGIAVIMDIVLNHAYGQNPLVRMYFNSSDNKPSADNPWFNINSPNPVYSWGYDFNHQSTATQAFVDSVCNYWITEYRIDGFRFDFTKGFSNTPGEGWAYDASRIEILKRMGDKIWSYSPGAYLILEHFADNNEETVLANHGFLLWGNSKHDYLELAMGYNSNIASASYKNLGWSKPGLVTYMESHDEERMMYKNLTFGKSSGSYDIREFRTALKRAKLAGTFFFTIPGPKMLWQFQELGYDYSIDFNGRLGEKPIRWDYYDNIGRKSLYDHFRALIELKKTYAVFSTDNFSISQQQGLLKRINLQHSEMDVVVLGNFDLAPGIVNSNFTRTGMWYDYFRGDSLQVTSSTIDQDISLLAGEYRLYTSKKIERPSYITSVGDTRYGKDVPALKVYPNPFSYDAHIGMPFMESGHPSRIDVFSINATPVRTIIVPAGSAEVIWDGNSDAGINVAPGIYLIRVTSAGMVTTSKIVKK